MSEIEDDDIEEIVLWKQTKSVRFLSLNPVLRCIVDGLCDENCVFSMLSGMPHIVLEIWNCVTQHWKRLIRNGDVYSEVDDDIYGEIEDVLFSYPLYGDWTFPKPNNICINMMPFIMERTFAKCMLPDYLEPYWDDLINKEHFVGRRCSKLIPDDEIGKIGFLTIHESYIEEGKSQRRGGIHIESPGKLRIELNKNGEYVCMGRVYSNETSIVDDIESRSSIIGDGQIVIEHFGWGMGRQKEKEFIGGIYMASNVSNSCKIWNCKILPDENGNEIIGSLGDVEHLREFLPEEEMMEENQMYWLTDRTPHESLPLEEGTYRQYFRLVTSEVSVWFEEHSTKNPLGIVPDPEKTIIVKGSKFENNSIGQLSM